MRNSQLRCFNRYLLISVSALLIAVSCEDSPTDPGSSSEYVVYFNAGTMGKYYPRWHPSTGLVDSVVFPAGSGSAMAISPGGSPIFLGNFTYLAVVSADSLELITRLPYNTNYQGIAISSDRRYVAVAGDSGLYILSGANYAELYHYPGTFFYATFSRDGSTIYCISDDSANGVCRTSITSRGFQSEILPKPDSGFLYRLIVSPDQATWYLMLKLGTYTSRLVVYDVEADSIKYSEDLVPGSGDLAMSPNGRYVFFSNPGTILNPPPQNTRLSVFDVRENQVIKTFALEDYVDEDPPHAIVIGPLAVTPDGEYLVCLSGPLGFEFAVINARTLEFVDYKVFGHNLSVGEVVCE